MVKKIKLIIVQNLLYTINDVIQNNNKNTKHNEKGDELILSKSKLNL